jgi:hypothetical protein
VFTGFRLLALLVAAAGAGALLPAETARLPPAAEQAIAQISAGELRAHVEALAGDDMRGRAIGQAGNQQAVQYIADALREARVAPAGRTYFQAVDLYQASLGSDARLTIASGAGEPLADLSPGPDFYPLPESADGAVSGALVFAGHGISAPKLRHDDYARRDVAGAIVLVLDAAPDALIQRPGLSRDDRAELGSVERKIADAHAHGARGIVIIRASPGDPTFVWRQPSRPRDTTYRLHSTLERRPVPVAVLSQEAAEPVRRALASRAALTAVLRPAVVIQRLTVQNVIGALGPAGPAADEFVVAGAHLDHEGVDAEGRVYNGADDNASGTAAVLAIAAALTRASAAGGLRPRRRIVFAFWNAEERGSLGAEAYLASPPPGRVVANINLDMVGRGEDMPNAVHLLGYTYTPGFAALARRANASIGLTLKEEWDRDGQGLVRRSDNWPFLKRGIPALFFTTGLHPDYHTPNDDADRLDFARLERIAELAGRLAWLVADGEPPRFEPAR